MSLIVNPGVREARERVEIKRLTDMYEDISSSIKVPPDEYPLVKEKLYEWFKDESYFDKYDKYSITKPGTVLVRLFRYENEHEYIYKNLAGGKKAVKFMLLPFFKVIKAHPEDMFGKGQAKFKRGDVITVLDSYCDLDVNPEWIMWKDRMDKERPQPGLPEPPKFKGILLVWSPSRLICNKFEVSEDDDYTFLRNENDFDLKYEY